MAGMEDLIEKPKPKLKEPEVTKSGEATSALGLKLTLGTIQRERDEIRRGTETFIPLTVFIPDKLVQQTGDPQIQKEIMLLFKMLGEDFIRKLVEEDRQWAEVMRRARVIPASGRHVPVLDTINTTSIGDFYVYNTTSTSGPTQTNASS